MATSRKVLHKLGFQLNAGLDDGGSPPNDGWGDDSNIQTLGSGDLLGYTDGNPNGMSEVVVDDTINGQAHRDVTAQTQLRAEGSINGVLRYRGLDAFLYWCMGWERPGYSPLANCQFTVSGVTTATVGEIYTNNSNDFTLTGVDLTAGAGTLYATRTSGSNEPSGDTLELDTGSGDAEITFSATSGIYQSHCFEFDKDRHFVAYRSTPDEQTADDYNSGDRKCRMATIGIAKQVTDHLYHSAMCKKFGISSTAGEKTKFASDFLAYKEARGDYSSANWTPGTDAAGTAYEIMHHHWTASLYTGSTFTDVGLSDFEFTVDIPLNIQQDTESGLYIVEPVLEDKFNITGTITISRYAADTYLAGRDSFTTYALRLIASNGDDQFKILVQDIRLKTSTTDDGVPKISIPFELGYKGNSDTIYTYDLEGHALVHNNAIVIITNNQNSTNEMRRE